MRITSLEIERFGVWEHLYLPKISRGLNLFYGPNEAGKTTLMQFIRSGLYGCSNPERARYIQMALYPKAESPFVQNRISPIELEETKKGKKKSAKDDFQWIGGALTLTGEFGQHRLERRYIKRGASYFDRQNALEAKSGFIVTGGLAAWSGRFFPIPGMGIAESLIVTGEDGARLSDHFVQTLVNNVDEATFNNVFAIGLDELQRLGALNETDAAQMLYRLSVGLDRVSLIQVLHHMVEERNDIFDIKGKPAILDALIARREEFSLQAQGAAANLREYAALRTERNEVEEAIRQLEEKLSKHRRQQRIYEIAHQIAPLWDERKELRLKLDDYGSVIEVEGDATAEARKRAKEIDDVRSSLNLLGNEYRENRKKLKSDLFNHVIWQNAPRIDLLVEEIPHLERIDEKVAAVQREIAVIQKNLDLEEQRLRGARHGKILLTPGVIKSLTTPPVTATEAESITDPEIKDDLKEALPEVREIEDYHLYARGVNVARKRYLQVKEQNAVVAERLKEITENLDKELASRGQKNLDQAMEATGELLVQLRRRQEIGKNLSDLEKVKKELTRQNSFLVANQSLPYPVTIAIGIGVALAGLLAIFAFLGKKPLEPSYGVLGVLVAAGLLFYKTTIEKRNFSKLEENQRQLSVVMKRLEQIKGEIAAIDSRYPAPGQSIEARLQKAETDMACFERLVPLDSKWKETTHHQTVLQNRLQKASKNLKAAHHRWIGWLKTAGLSTQLKPANIRAMIQRVDFADGLQHQISLKRNEIDLLYRERRGITDQLDRILNETGSILPNEKSAMKLIRRLSELLEEVRLVRKRRADYIHRINNLRSERNKVLSTIRKMENDLSDYLSGFDAKSVDHLEKLAVRYQEHRQLTTQLESVEARIETGIAEFCPEEEIADILDDEKTRQNLPTLRSTVAERIATLSEEQKEKTEHRGRLTEQLENLARRKDAVGQLFEKAALTRRIDQMARIWQSRAVACKMMEDIRKAYEKERQPETLKEASRLLSRLTDGLYVKIWTPLGEDALFVDTSDGQTLDIASLSRGTREQLFIAIRLALAISFEKHGISLPLILDDVLVNFDNHRAAAAANVLHEFAESGRQIFLFTCHQHICQTFLKLETPVFILPDKTKKIKQFRVILPPDKNQIDEEPEEKKPAVKLHEPKPNLAVTVEGELEPEEAAPLPPDPVKEDATLTVAEKPKGVEDIALLPEPPAFNGPEISLDAPEVDYGTELPPDHDFEEESDEEWEEVPDEIDEEEDYFDEEDEEESDEDFEEEDQWDDDEEDSDSIDVSLSEDFKENLAETTTISMDPVTEPPRPSVISPVTAKSETPTESKPSVSISGETTSQEADPSPFTASVAGKEIDLDRMEGTIVSAETPVDNAPEEESVRGREIQFSQWNDYFKPEEPADQGKKSEEETEREERKEENEFIRNYFVRETEQNFFGETPTKDGENEGGAEEEVPDESSDDSEEDESAS